MLQTKIKQNKKTIKAANDIKGEWFPIESGSFAGYYVMHLNTENIVIFAKEDKTGTLIPEFYVFNEVQTLQ